MRTEIEKRLKKEGWSGKDLSHLDEILEDEKKQEKHAHIKKHLTHFSFWTLLLGVIIINFIMAVCIVPFLLFLQGPIILISSIILGFLIGFMFNYMALFSFITKFLVIFFMIYNVKNKVDNFHFI